MADAPETTMNAEHGPWFTRSELPAAGNVAAKPRNAGIPSAFGKCNSAVAGRATRLGNVHSTSESPSSIFL